MRVWELQFLVLLSTTLVVDSRDEFPILMTMLTDDVKDSLSTDIPRQMVLMVGPPAGKLSDDALSKLKLEDHQATSLNSAMQTTPQVKADLGRNASVERLWDGRGNNVAGGGKGSRVGGLDDWLKRRRMKRRLPSPLLHSQKWSNPSETYDDQSQHLPNPKLGSRKQPPRSDSFSFPVILREEAAEDDIKDKKKKKSAVNTHAVEELPSEHGETAGSPWKRGRTWLGRRDTKRYRLGLYDCIVSYCSTMEGDNRKLCIAYNCHRSLD